MFESHSISKYVKAAQSGDESAWNFLYQHHYPALYAIALRMCKDVHEAKDAVQDTFINAHLKLSQLKEAAAFGGWLKKVLVHTCYRSIYSKQNKYAHLPVESDTWWEDEFNRKLEWLSGQSRLYTTLAHLPEVLQTTLLLRYFSSYQSYQEIADILSIPVGTVRSRLNQAKQKLIEQWRQHKNDDEELLKKAEEWNRFYQAMFSEMHWHDNYKEKIIAHLKSDVHLTMVDGKSNIGRSFFEKIIIGDREAGSWLLPANVTSSGNISIVESEHFNSPENPTHCPPRSVLVLYRNERKVSKMNFHFSRQ